MKYRKVGGIHWLAIGHHRIAYCRSTRRETAGMHQWAVLSLGLAFYGLIIWSVFG